MTIKESSQPRYRWEVLCEDGAGPPPRSRHGLAYDSTDECVVLFSGVDWDEGLLLYDTWELHGNEWSECETDRVPPPRHRTAMVYDSVRECCVLFGGQTQKEANWPMLGDTWLYRDSTWTRWGSLWGTRPPDRCGHMLAFDEALGETVLFGGISVQGVALGDTWSFDGRRWKQWKIAGPRSRRYSAFAYHPLLKGCLLNAGAWDDNGQMLYSDTWIFRGGEWKQVRREFPSLERDDHNMVWHDANSAMLLFGGLRADVPLEQFSKQGWIEARCDEGLPRMQCSPAVYVPGLQGVVLFGGETGHHGSNYGETWLLRTLKSDSENLQQPLSGMSD